MTETVPVGRSERFKGVRGESAKVTPTWSNSAHTETVSSGDLHQVTLEEETTGTLALELTESAWRHSLFMMTQYFWAVDMERCTDHNITSALILSTLTSCAPCVTLLSRHHSWCLAPTGQNCFICIIHGAWHQQVRTGLSASFMVPDTNRSELLSLTNRTAFSASFMVPCTNRTAFSASFIVPGTNRSELLSLHHSWCLTPSGQNWSLCHVLATGLHSTGEDSVLCHFRGACRPPMLKNCVLLCRIHAAGLQPVRTVFCATFIVPATNRWGPRRVPYPWSLPPTSEDRVVCHIHGACHQQVSTASCAISTVPATNRWAPRRVPYPCACHQQVRTASCPAPLGENYFLYHIHVTA